MSDQRKCQDHILSSLVAAASSRGDDLAWIERERFVVANAANEWTQAHGYDRLVTVEDVERLEVTAVGHVDYGAKLALYVAEFALAASPPIPPEETQ